MNIPRVYRKKPVMIEAMRWAGTASAARPIIDWILANGGTARYVGKGENHPMRYSHEQGKIVDPRDGLDYPNGKALATAPAFLVIETLEGAHRQDAQDFTVKGVAGEFYPCKPDIFEATYEQGVETEPAAHEV